MTRLAVVTTFSKEGWEQYAEAMVTSWVACWPDTVDLLVYPDEKVGLPKRDNVRVIDRPIPAKEKFIRMHRGNQQFRGLTGAGYNYRYDAIKFCHKPFAIHDALNGTGIQYDGLIWLDADTITHTRIDDEALARIAPMEHDVQFLGRSYKYTECGYLFFNTRHDPACRLINRWVQFYTEGTFRYEAEWHDSWLFDLARRATPGLRGNDLTGHISRRDGGGHPFINCFLGRYMDHYKGDLRKKLRGPRKGDLFADHETAYWRDRPHARQRHKTNR